ncbi:putative chitinase [Flavobacterium sp. HSC-32F16]|uniref:hypothetical protein n=1 Tax=Flavobacterium sp. HSC-32F16 TaxID=2910964 RepID=UPI0020A46A91|nr:hypothetical protein [Flavobacterium sp. HSC-32F16]MCP2029599.1 putative chitinase [Flavobacterium sp. HSC-32F16]
MAINFYDYVSSYDFVPFAELQSSEDFKVISSNQSSLISTAIKEIYKKKSEVTIEFKPETIKKEKTILKFKLQQAHQYASDPDGYLRYKLTAVNGQVFVSNHNKKEVEHDLGVKRYDDIVEIVFSKNLMQSVKYIDFYYKDNSDAWLDLKGNLPDSWEHCGRVTIGAGSTCYCNRDFTEEDIIGIIYNLRTNQKMEKRKEAFFDAGSEFISILRITEGKIDEEKNRNKIKLFTVELNKMFEKFKITSCKRKIHFLGQMYLETIYFRYTYESRSVVPSNYRGGVAFQGRGMKQITHDSNYLKYYDYINETNYYQIYEKYSSKDSNGNINESVEYCIKNNLEVRNKGLDEAYYEKLKIFAKKLSEDLFHAFNSAGWYSTIFQKKTLAAMDKGFSDEIIKEVTKAINGGDNGLKERINFTIWTKNFLNYDKKCVNK